MGIQAEADTNGRSDIGIRGMSGKYTLVLVDGKRLSKHRLRLDLRFGDHSRAVQDMGPTFGSRSALVQRYRSNGRIDQ